MIKLIKIYLITNKDELKRRLINRNQNTEDEITKRFNAFDEDIKRWKDYDYIIINENLETWIFFPTIELRKLISKFISSPEKSAAPVY